MAGLETRDDFQGQHLLYLGSALFALADSTLPLFVTNQVDLRAGTHETFVFAIATDAAGPLYAGLELDFGTDVGVTNWGTAFTLAEFMPSGAVLYAPQDAPIYADALTFRAKLRVVTPAPATIPLTVSAYGWAK